MSTEQTTVPIIIDTPEGAYTFPCRKYRGAQLMAVNAVLGNHPRLQPRENPTADMYLYCRAIETVKACCDKFTRPDGVELPCVDENLLELEPDIPVIVMTALTPSVAKIRLSEPGVLPPGDTTDQKAPN